MPSIFETLCAHNKKRFAHVARAPTPINLNRPKVADRFPWRDLTQRTSVHCAESIRRYHTKANSPSSNPPFTTPVVAFDSFIDKILSKSGAPLSATLATLAMINWIAESFPSQCPLAMSSPHHLFLASYQLVLSSQFEHLPSDDNVFVECTSGAIPYTEILAVRLEVEDFMGVMRVSGKVMPSMDVSGPRQKEWALIKLLVNMDMGMDKCMDELFDLERVQEGDVGRDRIWMKQMESDMMAQGKLVYEHGAYMDEEEEDEEEYEVPEGFIVYETMK